MTAASPTPTAGPTLHYEADGTIAVWAGPVLLGGVWPSLDVPGAWCAQTVGAPLVVVVQATPEKARHLALGHVIGGCPNQDGQCDVCAMTAGDA